MTRATLTINATSEAIDQAVKALRNGNLVALPSETVYGLAARADDEAAVARIFKAKSRPAINPLISHIANMEMAEALVEFNAAARKLAQAFWPGPLTLVLPRKSHEIAASVSAGLDTLAIRMPAHPVMKEVIEKLGVALAAPSANRSGHLSPTRAEHVARDLDGKVDLILDGGATKVGIESTVVSFREEKVVILRHGSIDADAIAKACGMAVMSETEAEKPSSPGQLLRHYAPNTPLVLNSDIASPHLGFGQCDCLFNLSPDGDLEEAACNLFAMLDALDNADLTEIHISPLPDRGIGIAINDRLRRAASSVKKT